MSKEGTTFVVMVIFFKTFSLSVLIPGLVSLGHNCLCLTLSNCLIFIAAFTLAFLSFLFCFEHVCYLVSFLFILICSIYCRANFRTHPSQLPTYGPHEASFLTFIMLPRQAFPLFVSLLGKLIQSLEEDSPMSHPCHFLAMYQARSIQILRSGLLQDFLELPT